MTRDAREIAKAFDLIFEACNNIKDHEACDNCPLSCLCLDDPEVSVLDLGDLMSATSWDEFINYADNVEFSEEQRRVQYEDFRRDMARDDALLDGWESDY